MCAGCKLLQAVTVNPLFSCGKTNNDAGKRVKMSVPQTSLQICFLSVLVDLGFLGVFFSISLLIFASLLSALGYGGQERNQANPNVPNSSPSELMDHSLSVLMSVCGCAAPVVRL